MTDSPRTHASFVHLRVHSAFSLAEGALQLKALVELCKRHRMPAVAVTDTMNLFGALEFAVTAAKAGVQPIVGCQLSLRPPAGKGGTRPPAPRGRNAAAAPDQLVVLVQDATGWTNLLALVSKAYRESNPAEAVALSLDDLDGRSDGLIALTGGPDGGIGRLLAAGQGPAAAAMLDRLQALFPGHLYIELQRHGLEVEDRIEPALIAFAMRRDLPLLATNECFFADESMVEAHDALLCIAQGAYLSERERRRVTPEHRFKSAEDMAILFADLPEAIDNTLVVARRCGFMPTAQKPILPAFPSSGGRSEAEELAAHAAGGLVRRLAVHVYTPEMDAATRAEKAKPYLERLDYELGIIGRMGYAGYYLIVAEFIQWARANDVPVGPGRGSGAASVVAWALTITDLDPLRWGLLFERFLNPERVSMPDFDIDFCQENRDRVIRHVQELYGTDRVAQIITFGKLQARAVVRDVGRVLEMPYGKVDRIAKLVPFNAANPVTLAQAIKAEPQLQAMADEDEDVRRLLDLALKLEGLFRNSSTHAAGVVIGDRPLETLVPLYRDPRSDMPVTQYNMKYVEIAGLVKFDFLGLKTLDVLDRAVTLLDRRGVRIDLGTLPLDDPKTLDMLARGDTTGVFQCESSGVRDVLRRLKPDRFEDIIAVVALYRPGPMDNIPSYIRRKHGEEEVDTLHGKLEPVLGETYGIPIYQEQVLQMAQVLAGYSLGSADLLRRAMGKKDKAEMAAQRANFVAGAQKVSGLTADRAAQIFDVMDKFAGYGFNKAHAAAYALIAYRTAWLKANWPVEFLAASMTWDQGSTDRLALYRRELDRMGIALLPPDVNCSEADFSVETAEDSEGGERGAIRYALAAVRGVGRAAVAALAEERAANGPFRSLLDFAERADSSLLNRRQIESLVNAGAFDSLEPSRARVHAAIDTMLGYAQSVQREKASGQTTLFGGGAEAQAPRIASMADWTPAERLQRELDAIGFYLSAHPLDEYRRALDRLSVIPWATLPATLAARGGTASVKLAGAVLGFQQRTSQRGNRFAFVQLSDASGAYEVTVFAEALAEARNLLDGDRPVLVEAVARVDEGGGIRLTADRISALDAAVSEAAEGLKVWVDDISPLESLRQIVEREARGRRARGHIRIVVPTDEEEVEIGLAGGFLCSPQVRSAIRAIPGVVDVQEL